MFENLSYLLQIFEYSKPEMADIWFAFLFLYCFVYIPNLAVQCLKIYLTFCKYSNTAKNSIGEEKWYAIIECSGTSENGKIF